MPTVRHVLTDNSRRDLEDLIVRSTTITSTKADLQTTILAAGWGLQAFLETYDTLVVQGRINEYLEVS